MMTEQEADDKIRELQERLAEVERQLEMMAEKRNAWKTEYFKLLYANQPPIERGLILGEDSPVGEPD